MITSGDSGQIGSQFYDNQNALWREGEYHPILMDRADIEKHAAGRLVLSPNLDTTVIPDDSVKASVLQ